MNVVGLRVRRISKPHVVGRIHIANHDTGRYYVVFDSGCSGWIDADDLDLEG